MKPWIATASGGKFDFAEPRAEDVKVEDVAHALSLVCRFAGHVRRLYSVAEHCCRAHDLVAELSDPTAPPAERLALRRWALCHDAAEAYLGDVTAPLKSMLPDYRAIEAAVEKAVFEALGCAGSMPLVVKHADRVLCVTEARDLLPPPPEPWGYEGCAPLPGRIAPCSPAQAEEEFMTRWETIAHEGAALRGENKRATRVVAQGEEKR